MKEYLPYRISHIDLSEQQMPSWPEHEQQGRYQLFWWKHIALGHLFLVPGQSFSERSYQEKLTEAIRPALAFYAESQSQEKLKEVSWQDMLLKNDFAGWTGWMEQLLKPWLVGSPPVTVPVSVIICTRNRPAELKKCLDSICAMTTQPAEVIVVDNAREDEETEKLALAYKLVKYCQEPVAGLSYARNTGVLKASNEIIAFTDDDVLLHPDWIYRIWETFENDGVAAMTGLVIASELRTETQLIFEQHWSFNQGFADKLYDKAYFNKTLPAGPPVWDIGAGANMAFRKSLFQELGYFDERLGAGASGCSEDSEMWYRILLRGYSIYYNPRAIAFHKHRDDKAALHKQLYAYMRGFAAAALIQQKQHRQAGYRRHLFWILPKFYLKLLYRGFPAYRFRFQTIGVEVKGLLSGLVFYMKHRNVQQKMK